MQSVLSAADTHEASESWEGPEAVSGDGAILVKDILPDGPSERRKRRWLCALRAMDRLGLLGEENLIPALASRPDLRWLADEEGARWAILKELGRIGDPVTFEEAVAWTLENRPGPEQARAYVRHLRSGSIRPDGSGRLEGRSVQERATPSVPCLRGPRGM